MKVAELEVEFAKSQSEEITDAYIKQHGFPQTREALLMFATLFWIVGSKFCKENLS